MTKQKSANGRKSDRPSRRKTLPNSLKDFEVVGLQNSCRGCPNQDGGVASVSELLSDEGGEENQTPEDGLVNEISELENGRGRAGSLEPNSDSDVIIKELDMANPESDIEEPEMTFKAVLPSITIHPRVIENQKMWGSVLYSELPKSMGEMYDAIVHFCRNLFNIPSGKAGKDYKGMYFLVKGI